MDSQTEKLEQQVRNLEKLVGNLRETLLASHRHTVESFNTIDQNFEIVNDKIDKLVKASEAGFSDVGGKLDHLEVEVKKIQKVSNYSEEYENLLKISR